MYSGAQHFLWTIYKNLREWLISKQTSTREWQNIPQGDRREVILPKSEKRKAGHGWFGRGTDSSRAGRKPWHMAAESKGGWVIIKSLFNCWSCSNYCPSIVRHYLSEIKRRVGDRVNECDSFESGMKIYCGMKTKKNWVRILEQSLQ